MFIFCKNFTSKRALERRAHSKQTVPEATRGEGRSFKVSLDVTGVGYRKVSKHWHT